MIAYIIAAIALGTTQARPQVSIGSVTGGLYVCPPEGHWLLPHEYDCTKFYYCEYGVRWETPRDCALGTEFSFELQICVHPQLANCHSTGVPPTEAPETEAPETEAPTTQAPETEATTTQAPETEATTTQAPETEATTTQAPETEAPTTQAPETEAPTTQAPETEATTTQAPETEAPTTQAPETEATTTQAPETEAPTTQAPETEAPTTQAPETEATTTQAPETEAPTTQAPETEATTTQTPETEVPTTQAPETEAPTTQAPETEALTTQAPETEAPTTQAPETEAPTTQAPETEAPTTQAPETEAPTTQAPETEAPTTQAPETETPTTQAPETEAPETEAPETEAPATEAPTTTEEPTTEDTDVNECPADWDIHLLLAHETECDLYYSCVHGEKVLMPCAPGTHFNPAIQVCDWPENAGCANSGNSTGDNGNGNGNSEEDNGSEEEDNENEWLDNGCPADWNVHKLLPHESECDRYYSCVHGDKVLMPCSPGTHFNPVLQVCDWPQNAGCTNSGNSVEDNGNDNGSDAEDSDNVSGSGESNDNGCPADWNVHKLLPHESECDRYYSCVHGDKVLMPCSPGTHFNPTLQVCDWPENAGCTNSGNSVEDNGNGEDNSNGNGSVEEDSDDGSGSGESLDNGCPADWNVHKLLPHESECDRYYSCVHGDKVLMPCSPGTHFNPALQVCDWPENAGCTNSGNSVEDNGNGEDNSNGNRSVEEDSDDGSGSGESLDNGCPADWNVHKLLPHESECDRYYSCVHGNKVLMSCGPGTHFNPDLQVCDWPENAGCANSGNNGEDNGSGEGDISIGNSEEDYGNGSGENENSAEWLDNGCPADFSVHQLLPHESECGKYYQCVHGETIERPCSPGTHFNPTLQVCDWPENAGCANSGSSGEGSGSGEDNNESGNVEEGGNGNGSVEEDNESEESSGNGNGEEDTGNGGGDNSALESKCIDTCNVVPWAHDTDCDKFWRCDGEKVALVICSEGLHFNANSQTCDFICNANCVRDNAQTTIQNDGVRIFLPWEDMDTDLLQKYVRSHTITKLNNYNNE